MKTDEQRMMESSGTDMECQCPVPPHFLQNLNVHFSAVHFLALYFSDEQIVPAEMKTQEWLLPETTANFTELPLQYNGFCGYALVSRDGLLLQGRSKFRIHSVG